MTDLFVGLGFHELNIRDSAQFEGPQHLCTPVGGPEGLTFLKLTSMQMFFFLPATVIFFTTFTPKCVKDIAKRKMEAIRSWQESPGIKS